MPPMKALERQLEVIKRGTVELINEAELADKLKQGKPLRIKAGFDPTAPDLHLGHTVLIHKMRHFQELGHQVVFLIGDFTARIGDPSGRNATRPELSKEQITENIKTYTDQVFKILDRDKTEIRYNSEWLSTMSPVDMIRLMSKYNVARMLERDDFKKRYESGTAIRIHEFLYPLLQGWDSVELKADVELGGNDQKFNLLVGRALQEDCGQSPQVVLLMPLLEGIDGIRKMSKSYDNYIGINEKPQDMYGKIMSISDDLMWKYYELLSAASLEDIRVMKQDVEGGALHPKKVKSALAKEVIALYHCQALADEAEAEFENIFAKGNAPSDIPETLKKAGSGTILLVNLIAELKLTDSKMDARRMIGQNAVSLNNEKVSDQKLALLAKGDYLIQVGKRRFHRLRFE